MLKCFTDWLERNGFGHELATAKTDIQIKQAMYATVVRACSNCGSPGVDSRGIDVGSVCTVCFAVRPQNEELGQIWKKER